MKYCAFSILERIVVVETPRQSGGQISHDGLSVSSNGSWWLKQVVRASGGRDYISFSILERIVVVETMANNNLAYGFMAFSILERIVVVETGKTTIS